MFDGTEQDEWEREQRRLKRLAAGPAKKRVVDKAWLESLQSEIARLREALRDLLP